MLTEITIKINTNTGDCSIKEQNAEAVETRLDTSSLEATAWDAGEALKDYIEGLN